MSDDNKIDWTVIVGQAPNLADMVAYQRRLEHDLSTTGIHYTTWQWFEAFMVFENAVRLIEALQFRIAQITPLANPSPYKTFEQVKEEMTDNTPDNYSGGELPPAATEQAIMAFNAGRAYMELAKQEDGLGLTVAELRFRLLLDARRMTSALLYLDHFNLAWPKHFPNADEIRWLANPDLTAPNEETYRERVRRLQLSRDLLTEGPKPASGLGDEHLD